MPKFLENAGIRLILPFLLLFLAAPVYATTLYSQPIHDAPSKIPKFAGYPTQKNVIVNALAATTIKSIATYISENYCGTASLFDSNTNTFAAHFSQVGSTTSPTPREVLFTNLAGFTLTAGHSYDLIFGCNARDGTWNGSLADNYNATTSVAGSSLLGLNFLANADVADYSFIICDSTQCSFPPPLQRDPVIIIPGILGSSDKNGVWVIDPIFHTYDDLIATLKANGYTDGTDLFTFPYDWRQSNIITAVQLRDKINEVQNICHCAKVDLAAHSMGGLVARQYIQSTSYENDVDQLIFLGTPHLGAPFAYLTWEGGETGTKTGTAIQKIKDLFTHFFLSREARKAGFANLFDYVRNKPILSIQELLPIYDYLRDKSTGSLRTYPNNYPQNIFLDNLKIGVLNLLDRVKTTNIVGELGNTSTLNAIRVINSPNLPLWESGYPDGFDGSTVDRGFEFGFGDGTVPKNSSEFIANDLNELSFEHNVLPTKAEGLVFKKLTGKDASTLVDTGFSLNLKLLIIKILSPVDVLVTAPDGKRIGKDFASGNEVNEIDGAFYSGFLTDDEYLTIPNPLDGEYKVEVQGTGSGSYTVATGYISDSVSVDKDFTAQTQPGMTAELNLSVNNANPSVLEIKPSDITPPEIKIISPQAKDYLRSETLPINVSVSDAESGVFSQTIKFDDRIVNNGDIVDLFFEKLSSHKINVNAVDFVGNATSSQVNFMAIATIESTISDIERAYLLGWIAKKEVKKELLEKLRKATKIEKKIETSEEKLPDGRKLTKRIEKLEKKSDKVLGKEFLKELEENYKKGRVNQQAYNLLKEDINWLLNN